MISRHHVPNQPRSEEVIVHLRRHWFIFLKTFLGLVILAVLPVGVYQLISANTPELLASNISYPLLLVLFLSYYLIILVFAFTAWTSIYLDVWTVTTDRIINTEQQGLFNRVVAELDLRRIQDVTAEQKGLFPTMLHYGEVYVQSAGTKERFVFEQVPRPYQIAKLIQRLDEKAKKNPVV